MTKLASTLGFAMRLLRGSQSHFITDKLTRLNPLCFNNLLCLSCSRRRYSESKLDFEINKDDSGEKLLHRRAPDNPLQHAPEHAGMMFRVDPSEEVAYRASMLPQFIRASKAFGEISVMIREPALEIFSYLDVANYQLPAIRYCLHGPDSIGKTTALCHITQRYVKAGWLVVHHPFVSRMFRSYSHNRIEESRHKPGRLDNPVTSRIWLSHFRSLNSQLLSKLDFSTSKEYQMTKKESLDADMSINDLLKYGIENEDFATDVAGILLREIKQQSQSGKFRVLVALDGINALFEKESGIENKEVAKTFHSLDKFSIVHQFRKMITSDWENAAVVGVVDRGAHLRETSHHLIDCLGTEGFHALNPFIPVEIKSYSDDEALNFLSYLQDKKFLQHPFALTEAGRRQLMMISEKKPLALYNATLRW